MRLFLYFYIYIHLVITGVLSLHRHDSPEDRIPPYEDPPISQANGLKSHLQPSHDAARENAFLIFNSIHSALRQWGSSLRHNGLALIPTVVPEGTVLYHGASRDTPPTWPDWLAFMPEHAEIFATSFKKMPHFNRSAIQEPDRHCKGPWAPLSRRNRSHRPEHGGGDQKPLGGSGVGEKEEEGDDGRKPDFPHYGYLHNYRATRDLKMLYIDGMSAAKTSMGTMDTQDFMLRGLDEDPGFDEWCRAEELCALAEAWGLDGIMRMEIGFEVIYCDFLKGLEQISVLQRPFIEDFEGAGGLDQFSWIRAAARRYDGLERGRAVPDYSRMVSALWYPVNVTGEEENLPRLRDGTTAEERASIAERVREVSSSMTLGAKKRSGIDWQGVADSIVIRYSERVGELATDEMEDEWFTKEILRTTNTFYDAPPLEVTEMGRRNRMAGALDETTEDAVQRCSTHFFEPAIWKREQWTEEDGLIHTALETVTTRICTAFFQARRTLVEAAGDSAHGYGWDMASSAASPLDDLNEAVEKSRGLMKALKKDLQWTDWDKCVGCDIGELCFVAMWPLGLEEDHYHPQCVNRTSLDERLTKPGPRYWKIAHFNEASPPSEQAP